MRAIHVRSVSVCLLIGIMVAVLVGCSTETPTEPANTSSYLLGNMSAHMTSPPEGIIQFSDIVATVDTEQRLLTFVDRDETVIAADDCEIVAIESGVETTIEFADINVGDRTKICGTLQEDGTILANRICVCTGFEFSQYELAFRDVITNIDYGAGTFTVGSRTETITVDEFTLIWGVTPDWHARNRDDGETIALSSPNPNDDTPERTHHVYLTFTDLQVGDTVEVKANVVDESTLYAVNIKLANSSLKVCNEFEFVIANIDYVERLVTFVDNDWTGYVCPGAELLDADGGTIVLEDFQVSDAVYVKGHPLEDADKTLNVCVMTMLD